MYEFTSRVRYSEVGEDGRMKLSAIAARMQDCCVFHAESIGRGPKIWQAEHCGWMILTWQILIHSRPEFAQTVTTKTWSWQFRGIRAYRNFTMENEDREVLAEANTLWIYYDMEKGAPIRVREEDVKGYGTEPRLETFSYATRHIDLPESGGSLHEPFEIVRTNLDTNQHVNNLQYIDMAIADLPDGTDTKELRVEYVQQVKLGEKLAARTWAEDGRFLVSLENESGKPCANVEFLAR